MKLDINQGEYVLAVSGGVDSMVLLDILRRRPDIEIIVAHFNHGIRSDSHLDEELVQDVAGQHNLRIEIGHGKLGPNTSEATARTARYKFLREITKKHKAKAIITAHHQDDLIETVLLNILRGTKRKGLSSLSSSDIQRPLLSYSKKQIRAYADRNKINWREDTTNDDTKYLRNHLRKNILPKMSALDKKILTSNLDKVADINNKIDEQIAIISRIVIVDGMLGRQEFTLLPSSVSQELLIYWLKNQGVNQVPKQLVSSLSNFIKTGSPDSRLDVKNGHGILLGADFATWS